MDHKDIPATARVSAALIFDHTPGATGSVWDRLKRLTNTL